MGFTQQEILEALEESGRNDWNLRQMTALRKEGFLPPLRRETQPGTNRPQYVWDETDLDQIAEVYDWWSYYDGDRASLTLALWIQGYNVPLDLLRRTYIAIIEKYLQTLTHGKTDYDDILDEVSKIVLMWMRKLRYSPGLADRRRKMKTEQNMNMEQVEMLIERVLGGLAVPEQEVVIEEIYTSLIESQDTSIDYEDDDLVAQSQNFVAMLRDIFTFPHLLEAIRTATPEQWLQARADYLSLCRVLNIIETYRSSAGEAYLPEHFIIRLKIMGATWLITPLLSTRFYGYGQWIDKALEDIYEFLADPAVHERVLNMRRARKAIETEVESSEKPELSITE